MESDAIEKILESVAAGKTTPAEALLSLKKEPFTDLGYAKVDHHRALRQNATEVIYGEGKYHAFYTGYCLTAEYQQTICHATSEDGITWTKDAANPDRVI